MKITHILFCYFLLFIVTLQLAGQKAAETQIQLKDISVLPADISQPGSGIQNIADGKAASDSEIFHTLWKGIPKQEIVVEAILDGKGKRLDKIRITPRENGQNGIIKQAEIWVMSKGKYSKVYDLQSDAVNVPVQIELQQPIKNPQKIKLVIQDAFAESANNLYMVSLGEVECLTLGENAITQLKLQEDAKIFAEMTGETLVPEVNKRKIDKMKVPVLRDLARKLYQHTYQADSLSVLIQPMLHPDVLGKEMRIGNGYSKLEGITGVYLNAGENIVFVGKTNGLKVNLVIPEWTRKAPEKIKPEKDPAGWGLKKEFFSLKEGVNYVQLKKGGNAYIQYFTESSPENYPAVRVHFPTGKHIGYFDLTRGDTEADFAKLLSNNVSPIVDLRGKHIQVAFPVESLKKYAAGRGKELIQNYDSVMTLQQKMLGWYKEGIIPQNHVLVRVNYHYYMFRDEDGVAFIDWAMKLVADPSSVIKGDPCWGFSHEIGHIHQMRPQMTWGGMTEVSNNILTMYSTTAFNNKSRLSEGKIYQKAREIILDKGISYMDFPGKKEAGTNQYGGKSNTDVLQRLVPFWQLHLYFKEQGYPDFYADLMIAMRKQKLLSEGKNNMSYLNMLEFCRLACEVSKTDLTEFFERWGFFYVGEIDVTDYAEYEYQVSKEDVAKVKKAIADMHLPLPVKDITLFED